jgi:hypothetical protein
VLHIIIVSGVELNDRIKVETGLAPISKLLVLENFDLCLMIIVVLEIFVVLTGQPSFVRLAIRSALGTAFAWKRLGKVV